MLVRVYFTALTGPNQDFFIGLIMEGGKAGSGDAPGLFDNVIVEIFFTVDNIDIRYYTIDINIDVRYSLARRDRLWRGRSFRP